MENARRLLGKSIPMWVRYANMKPQQSWIVIHLLKDALFVLDRYSELENILSELNKNFPNNIEILGSLADYYAHKGYRDKIQSIIDKKVDFILLDTWNKIEVDKQKYIHYLNAFNN